MRARIPLSITKPATIARFLAIFPLRISFPSQLIDFTLFHLSTFRNPLISLFFTFKFQNLQTTCGADFTQCVPEVCKKHTRRLRSALHSHQVDPRFESHPDKFTPLRVVRISDIMKLLHRSGNRDHAAARIMAAFEHQLARARSSSSSTRSNPPSHAGRSHSSHGLPAFLQGSLAGSRTPRLQRKCSECASGEAICPKCAAHHDSSHGLTLNQPGDPFEREADQFAQFAVENPRRASRSSPPTFASGPASPVAQLKPAGAPAPNAMKHALPASDSGDALTSDLRQRMEPLAGADLSTVRVHSSLAARQTASSLHAKAFTHQNHIWLGPGESPSDLPLMAHEVAHVIQQSSASRATPQIQRQPVDAGPAPDASRDAGLAPFPPAPPTAGPCPDPLPHLPDATGYFFSGIRFDAEYKPTGPFPIQDPFKITHRINIDFLPFSTRLIREQPRLFGKYRGVRFTAAQRAQFAWTDAEKTTYKNDFKTNVQTIWSAQHALDLNEVCFARYRAMPMVNIEFVDDPERAHSRVTAYKMPSGTARLRSEVSSGSATLESRDPSVPTSHWVAPYDWVKQVGPFEFNSSAINPDVEADVAGIASLLSPVIDRTKPNDPFPVDSCLSMSGRASSEGSASYNEKLARERVKSVELHLEDKLGLPHPTARLYIGTEPGERNATTDPQFRRVDVRFSRLCAAGSDVPQNVAAHEFGHLIGFGDEYVDEKPPTDVLPKFEGDRPTHYGDVEAALGTAAAEELIVQDSASIMSEGNQVRRGHYVYFLQAINRMTGRTWTVT
jgi:hypothetical protein